MCQHLAVPGDVAHPAAAAADGAVGDADGVGALPRLVAVTPAVEALQLVLLQGPVQDVEVVHVLGAQGDHPGAVRVFDLAGRLSSNTVPSNFCIPLLVT